MCNACPTIDTGSTEHFARRMLGVLNDAALAMMVSLGHRTGLLDAMSTMTSATSRQIAQRAGLNERYVREWLGAMVTGRIVEHDASDGTYRLPAEHASLLTRAGNDNFGATAQWIAVLGSAESEVARAFVDGGGVPYCAYERFHEVMAEESNQTVVAALESHILPLVDGLRDRLEAGIDVLDTGCGAGRAMIQLAQRFPNSRFVGVDFSAEAIKAARYEAAGLTNVRFEILDAAALPFDGEFDLVTAFDAVHDQAKPDAMLASIRRALRPDGTYLMQEIKARTAHADNLDHPLGPFIYTISCMHCMSVSLAAGGMGLGAAWGREKATQMLGEAGFESIHVHELEHDIMNDYYVCHRAA